MERIKTLGLGLAEGAALMAVFHWFSGWWAVPIVVVLIWLHNCSYEAVAASLYAIASISTAIVLALNVHLSGQILVVIGFGLWQLGRSHYANKPNFQMWQAGWLEFLALCAIFSAEAIWHWPTALVLTLVYFASLGVAGGFISESERAARALAAAWGLIVVEASLLFSVWLVQYVLPRAMLLVPQPAIVITALGYCFGSIYIAHANSRLSRARLAEYAIIGLCLVAIVIAGTRWSGAV